MHAGCQGPCLHARKHGKSVLQRWWQMEHIIFMCGSFFLLRRVFAGISDTGDSGCVRIAGGIDGTGGIALIAGGGGILALVVHGGGSGVSTE